MNDSKQERMGVLLERLAAVAHESWAGWMKWQWAKERTPEDLERWRRQAETSYANLSEREKESDRIEARKYLAEFNAERDAVLANNPDEVVEPA